MLLLCDLRICTVRVKDSHSNHRETTNTKSNIDFKLALIAIPGLPSKDSGVCPFHLNRAHLLCGHLKFKLHCA